MSRLCSIKDDGSVDVTGLFVEFGKIYQDLETKVSSKEKLDECKNEVVSLTRQLNSVASMLSHYDQETYSGKLDSLLKRITAQQRHTASKEERKARWKNRSNPVSTPAAMIRPASNRQEQHQEGWRDTVISYDIGKNLYENLTSCELMWKGSETVQDFATLAVKSVTDSLILFDILPFSQGSVYLENCRNSKVIIITAEHSNIQMRLHELTNCQLYIRRRSGDQPQDVIIENFTGCTFHDSIKDNVRIHNFSQLDCQNKLAERIKVSFDAFELPFDAGQ